MTVCLDTGVFLQIFGRKQPFHPILRALLDSRTHTDQAGRIHPTLFGGLSGSF